MKNKENSISWTFTNFCWLIIQRVFPAKMYLSLRYRIIFGRWINWDNPKTFTEKLQWLKLYYYGRKEAVLVDKIKVKEYIKGIIGDEYIIPTIGTWEDANNIQFDSLPCEYVLKCNHDSGSVHFQKEDAPINRAETIKELNKVLKTNYYWTGRETPYRYVKPRVFAEQLIRSDVKGGLRDYKFFCFNGEPKVFKIDFNRFNNHKTNYFDIDGNLLPFGEADYPTIPDINIEVPQNLPEMVELARKIAVGLPFARIDLYNTNGKILFGEITLFPTSGFGRFTDDKWDRLLGSWLELPNKLNNLTWNLQYQ